MVGIYVSISIYSYWSGGCGAEVIYRDGIDRIHSSSSSSSSSRSNNNGGRTGTSSVSSSCFGRLNSIEAKRIVQIIINLLATAAAADYLTNKFTNTCHVLFLLFVFFMW